MAFDAVGGRLSTYHACSVSGEQRRRNLSPIRPFSYPQPLLMPLEASAHQFICLRFLEIRFVCPALEGTHFSKATRPLRSKEAISGQTMEVILLKEVIIHTRAVTLLENSNSTHWPMRPPIYDSLGLISCMGSLSCLCTVLAGPSLSEMQLVRRA
jgi:hypothetical protein